MPEETGLGLSSFTEICLRRAVCDKSIPFMPSLTVYGRGAVTIMANLAMIRSSEIMPIV